MPRCNFCTKEAIYRLEGIYYCEEHAEPEVKAHLDSMEEKEKKKERKANS